MYERKIHPSIDHVGARLHALPKRSFYAVHSEPQLFFEPGNFTTLIADPRIIGLHISPKARCHKAPLPGSLHAWAVERFGQ